MSGRSRDLILALALTLLAGLYAWWFRADRHLLAVALVFVAPPVLLLLGVLAQRAVARFWADRTRYGGTYDEAWMAHYTTSPIPVFPADVDKKMIKNDFEWAAKNRERVLAEWSKRYESKAAPKN